MTPAERVNQSSGSAAHTVPFLLSRHAPLRVLPTATAHFRAVPRSMRLLTRVLGRWPLRFASLPQASCGRCPSGCPTVSRHTPGGVAVSSGRASRPASRQDRGGSIHPSHATGCSRGYSCLPPAQALAAVLRSWDLRPYRAPRPEQWHQLYPGAVGGAVCWM